MKRILILGPCGAGKTELAKALESHLNISRIGMDDLYWKGSWQRMEISDYKNLISERLNVDDWIMDGSFFHVLLKERIYRSTHIIYLNYPPYKNAFQFLLRSLERFIFGTGNLPQSVLPVRRLNFRFSFFFKKVVFFHKIQGPIFQENLAQVPQSNVLYLENNWKDKKTFYRLCEWLKNNQEG